MLATQCPGEPDEEPAQQCRGWHCRPQSAAVLSRFVSHLARVDLRVSITDKALTTIPYSVLLVSHPSSLGVAVFLFFVFVDRWCGFFLDSCEQTRQLLLVAISSSKKRAESVQPTLHFSLGGNQASKAKQSNKKAKPVKAKQSKAKHQSTSHKTTSYLIRPSLLVFS